MRFFVASAGPKFWQDSGGGSWNNSGNWSPGGAPASFDDADFELGATYTVTFSADGAVHNIANGSDHVTLSLGGKTLLSAGTITGSGTVTLNFDAIWGVSQSFFAGRNGPAVVEINDGGQLWVTGTTKIYNSAGTELRLQGGSLRTGALDTSGNPSRFVWTS